MAEHIAPAQSAGNRIMVNRRSLQHFRSAIVAKFSTPTSYHICFGMGLKIVELHL
jgi:hypothetical protein